MKKVVQTILVLLFPILALAQPNWKWPEDKATAEEKYALFSDYVKADQFKKAIPPLRWLLTNCPDLHVSLYQNGAKTFEGAQNAVSDKTRKRELQDSALLMYDMRIKYFNDEANVLNRKGLKAYAYLLPRGSSFFQPLYDLYSKIIELNGDDTYSYNCVFYMDVLCRNKTAGHIDEQKVFQEYEKIVEILAANDKAKPKQKAQIDDILARCVEIDCDFVKKNLGPKFEANPDDLTLAKKIFSLMLKDKCTDDPLFEKATEKISESEPSAGIYRVLALKAAKKNDYNRAIENYEKALEMMGSEAEKGETYYDLARMHKYKGAFSTARTYAYKAANASSEYASAAYSLIGDMYYESYKTCKSADVVKSRTIFIAAYDMYKKAGASSKMQQAKSQFPSVTEIFNIGKKKGDTMNTGCWISEDVTLDTR